MKLLVIHPNFPAQSLHVITKLAQDSGNDVIFISDPTKKTIPGVKNIFVKFEGKPKKSTHQYLRQLEVFTYRGQLIWRACEKLKAAGFTPDIIWAHPGWGDALFIKDAFPNTPLINYAEFYYTPFGADMHFDPTQKVSMDAIAKTRLRNTHLLSALTACDGAIAPTEWQKSQSPKEFHDKITVIHEGIDTDWIKPNPEAKYTLKNGKTLTRDDEVVTYVARNFEAYRGFSQFMHAARDILKKRPNAHIIAMGADGVSYSKGPENNEPLRHQLLKELPDLDRDRLHFVGYVPHKEMINVLQISCVHIYLTYPFVLSWSFLEAMATGPVMIASKTAPVLELITHNENGLLVDFFDSQELAQTVCAVLKNPKKYEKIKTRAQTLVKESFSASQLCHKQIEYFLSF